MNEEKLPEPDVSTHGQLFQLYGLFMCAWSVLEGVIQAAIHKQLGVTVTKAVIVTGKLQFHPRVQLLIGLLRLHGNEHSAAIKLLNQLEGFAHRNTLVHGHIIVGTPHQLTFVKYDGGKSVKKTFTVVELGTHLIELSSRVESLQKLLGVSNEDAQAISDATLALAQQ